MATTAESTAANSTGQRAPRLSEDWWALSIGLFVVVLGCALFWSGGSLRWLAVLPPRWTHPGQVAADLAANWTRYGAQLLFWLAAFSVALASLGHRVRAFAPAFPFYTWRPI